MGLVIQIGSRDCHRLVEATGVYFHAVQSIEVLDRADSSFEFRRIQSADEAIVDAFCAGRISSLSVAGHDAHSEPVRAVATEPEFRGRRSLLWQASLDVQWSFHAEWARPLLGIPGLVFASIAVDDSLDLDEYDGEPKHFPNDDWRLIEAYLTVSLDTGLAPWRRMTGPAYTNISNVKKLR